MGLTIKKLAERTHRANKLLDLNYLQISDEDMLLVACYLWDNPTIKTLYINHNKIGVKGIKALAAKF